MADLIYDLVIVPGKSVLANEYRGALSQAMDKLRNGTPIVIKYDKSIVGIANVDELKAWLNGLK